MESDEYSLRDEAREAFAGATLPAAASLIDIARMAEATAVGLRRHLEGRAFSAVGQGEGEGPVTVAALRAVIAARRLRRDHFAFVAGDPVWSLLLELYAARLERRRIGQNRLAAAAGVPATTAFRMTRLLMEEGLVTATEDPADRRLVILALTDQAAERMRAYLHTALIVGAGGG